ncbi:hypothetical protein EVJ50_08225 [Synechococcus sp. RSCCF101]|uniref:hypothetical protein n=1 Tax=Synechococcus sp. RSCCF101 TaxID=2511069 RepID=UPI00124616D9|nr:hypothetical protein [Synechococcus sp. RSCCF101]QEY32213.1 hypothetical protein EVJ50_08225 [Synechococcus sp. RSCCF101]
MVAVLGFLLGACTSPADRVIRGHDDFVMRMQEQGLNRSSYAEEWERADEEGEYWRACQLWQEGLALKAAELSEIQERLAILRDQLDREEARRVHEELLTLADYPLEANRASMEAYCEQVGLD